MRGLLGAGKVLLAKYGRVDIQFDQPFDLKEALGDVAPDDEEAFRAAVRRVSHRIVYGIARATSVTPSALWSSVLLAPGKRGVAVAEARAGIALLEARARQAGARFTEAFERDRDVALDRALEMLISAGHVTRRDDLLLVPEDRRPQLEYYKNNAVNWYVAESLLSRTLLSWSPGAPVRVAELRSLTLDLSRLFKREFVYRVDASFDTIFDETLAGMAREGWLKVSEDQAAVTEEGREPLAMLAGLCTNFVESYAAAASALGAARVAMAPRDLAKSALQAAERMYLKGEISRREAVSRVTIGNALDYFEERGILTRSEGKLTLSADEDPSRLTQSIKLFLR
jgi:glycerol-3-phosphate O-acyltransferase